MEQNDRPSTVRGNMHRQSSMPCTRRKKGIMKLPSVGLFLMLFHTVRTLQVRTIDTTTKECIGRIQSGMMR